MHYNFYWEFASPRVGCPEFMLSQISSTNNFQAVFTDLEAHTELYNCRLHQFVYVIIFPREKRREQQRGDETESKVRVGK